MSKKEKVETGPNHFLQIEKEKENCNIATPPSQHRRLSTSALAHPFVAVAVFEWVNDVEKKEVDDEKRERRDEIVKFENR